jgi:hypothetical protein
MVQTFTRCERILALIDACLADLTDLADEPARPEGDAAVQYQPEGGSPS